MAINRREINGFIDTSKTARENIDTIANASGVFVTWDQEAGEWSFTLNDTGSSVKSFNDSNILGSVSVSGSSINELYNSCQINFPNKDLRKTVDTVIVSIDEADRYAQEIDNVLQINLNCINDPVQAQYIASRELKQSRVDKIIQFRTDFTANGLKAGDLIDITIDYYDFSSKIFRIISIDEEDGDDGSLIFSITALEYDADVYSTAGLERDYRSKQTDIIPEELNTEKDRLDDVDTGKDIFRLLAANAATSLLKNVLGINNDTGELTNNIDFQDPSLQSYMENFAPPALDSISGPGNACENGTVSINFGHSCSSGCFHSQPNVDYSYEITGVTEDDVTTPLTGTVTTNGSSGTLEIGIGELTEDKTMSVTIGGQSVDVNLAYDRGYSFSLSPSPSSITEGGSTTITITGTDVPDGDYNYTITGSKTDIVTTALTGTVTMTSNSGSITINTSDDETYSGSGSIIFTIDSDNNHVCSISESTVTINVSDANSAPTTCEYTSVPVVWCAIYDGDTGALTGVSVRQNAYLPVAQAGESTVSVPTSLSVSGGAISIDSTTDVASASNLGGIPFQIITSFNSVAANGLITGTTTTVYGYTV